MSEIFQNNVAMIVHGERELLIPAHLNFGKYVLDRVRKAEPNRTCWLNCSTGEKLSYGEFTQHAVRLASALAQRGVGRGDTVAVAGEPRVAALPTALAVMLTGAACTSINLECGKVILAHKLDLTKPKYIICSRLFWEAYSDLLKDLDFVETFICFEKIADIELNVEAMVAHDVATFEPTAVEGASDVAMILFSSGTTGMSKGVLLTHLNCIVDCNRFVQWYIDYDCLKPSQALQIAFFADPVHSSSYDFFTIIASICSGKTALYSENEVNLKVIQDFQVDTMTTVPTIIELMTNVEEDVDLSSLKLVYAAGSRLNPRTAKAFKERCPDVKLIHLYGASEVGSIATTQNTVIKGEDEVLNAETSVGCVAPDVMIKVLDLKTREALGPNQRGEVCVRSPGLMKGYLGATSPWLDDQGYYLTGDLGYYDEQKRIYLVDRLKDVIVYLDFKVCPGDVEAVLLTHAAVREAAVVGAPAGAEGDRATAFVVLQPGSTVTEAELIDYVAKEVVWYMRLHGGVRFISELPRNPRGKVLRQRLRENLEVEGNVSLKLDKGIWSKAKTHVG